MPVIRVDEFARNTGNTINYWYFKSVNDAVIFVQRANMHSGKARLFSVRDAEQDEIKEEIERLNAEIARLKINTEEATNNFYRLEPLFSALDWYKENLMEDETVISKVWRVVHKENPDPDTYWDFKTLEEANEWTTSKYNIGTDPSVYSIRTATQDEIRKAIVFQRRLLGIETERSNKEFAGNKEWSEQSKRNRQSTIDQIEWYRAALESMEDDMPSPESMERLEQSISKSLDNIEAVTLIKEKVEINKIDKTYGKDEYMIDLAVKLTGEEFLLLHRFLAGDL